MFNFAQASRHQNTLYYILLISNIYLNDNEGRREERQNILLWKTLIPIIKVVSRNG